MLLRAERSKTRESAQDLELCRMIEHEIKKQILLSVKVEVADDGSIPLSERKTKRIFDNRQ
jgi:phenylacetate-CoA ligase